MQPHKECVLLCVLTTLTCAVISSFLKDSTRLVLRPLARMMAMVREVSTNPLGRQSHAPLGAEERGHLYEPRILEHCIGTVRNLLDRVVPLIVAWHPINWHQRIPVVNIGKLCNLVAVGFGDAGAEIIADNIRSTQELDPMMPGKRVHAIYAFCDVRHFTTVTEVWCCCFCVHSIVDASLCCTVQVLQEEIMEFVNNIARIVHLEVTLHGGFPNKNVGDAFLLVWKLPPRPGDPRGPAQRKQMRATPSQPPSLQEVLDKYGIATEEQLPGHSVNTLLGATLGQAGDHTLQRCGPWVPSADHGETVCMDLSRWYARQCSSVADRALAAVVVIQASMKRARPLQVC